MKSMLTNFLLDFLNIDFVFETKENDIISSDNIEYRIPSLFSSLRISSVCPSQEFRKNS